MLSHQVGYYFQFMCLQSVSCLSCLQVKEVVKPPQPAPSSVIARPVRKAPPTSIHDVRSFPEIIPVQEVIFEESGEDLSSAQPSEKGWMPDKH